MSLKYRIFRNSFQTRVKWIEYAFIFIILVILARALYLQVIEKPKLEDLAERQYSQSITVKLQRGPILDSEGEILTVSLPLDSYFVVPSEVKEPGKTAEILEDYLQDSDEAISKKLTAGSSFVWLQRNLKPTISEQIENLRLPGIHKLTEYQRFYPMGQHASQLIGFSGIDSQGLEGLEFQYDQHLMAGTSRHSVIKALYSAPQLDNLVGGSLQLSINSKLQFYTEEELEKAVNVMDAKHGISIVLESQTGRVLAMATIPDFDPNNFSKFNRSTYFNRAVSAVYEPGSTFKIITISGALENEIIQEDNFFFCEEGEYQIQDRVIHDVAKYGWLSVEQIIQKSSNICAAKIGSMIPKPLLYKTIMDFGFGSKTGVSLPGEASGIVHNYTDWSETDVATMSFGHSISATPIQIIAALNAVATGGVLIEPTVVEEVKYPSGRKVDLESLPSKRILKPEVAKTVKKYMVSVTQPGGTGYRARIPGVTVAGKSGTTRKFDHRKKQYSSTNHLLTFVGFFPAENPKFTILTMIDEPRKKYEGVKSAAPVFREIAKHALRLYPLENTEPNRRVTSVFSERKGDERIFSEPRIELSDEVDYSRNLYALFKGRTLREALIIAERQEYTIDYKGSGVVRSVSIDPNNKRLLHLGLK